jgi:hypothetical protein
MVSEKEFLATLKSIDTSLRILAAAHSPSRTAGFVAKKDLATYLAVKPVTIDKLIHQGLVSGGTSGIVEGRHYCRLDPRDNNSSNFLFDATRVMADAWSNFSNYGTDGDV